MHSSLTFSISHQPPAPQARPGLLGRRGRCGSRALGSSAGFVPTAGRPGLAPVRREDAPVPQRPRCSPRPPLPGFPLYGWSGLEAAQGTAKPKASLSSQGLRGGFLEEGAPEQRPEEGLSQAREGGKRLPGRGDRVRQQQGVTPGLPGSWSRAQERRPEWLAGRAASSALLGSRCSAGDRGHLHFRKIFHLHFGAGWEGGEGGRREPVAGSLPRAWS